MKYSCNIGKVSHQPNPILVVFTETLELCIKAHKKAPDRITIKGIAAQNKFRKYLLHVWCFVSMISVPIFDAKQKYSNMMRKILVVKNC